MFVRMRQQSYLYELAALFIGLLGLQVATAADERGNLTVRTITGVYTGLVNEDYTNVREFRSIPYAQPPVGSLRWMPPVAVAPSGKHRYSQRFGPTCPQYMTKNLTLWNSNITDFKIDMGGQSNTIGAMAQTSTEDCLSLAIWTPLNISSNDSLPVAIFIPGGSFTGGGITVPYQNPAPFVSRHNNIIVVTLNYRVTIMGFPHAAALDDHNLGIMDQRMAVEWVKANIANFGGDPDRMILWGQSAGAVSADLHSWAYYDNPLVRGYFLHSGTAAVQKIPADPTYTNFTFVARNLGCDFPNDPAAELACMRQVPLSQIMNFVGQYQENNTKPSITFKLIPDDKIFFNNYSARADAGLMAKVPALISTTSNEDSSLYDYPVKNVAAGPNMTDVDLQTIKGFVCLASNTTNWRAQNNLTTYRFQYAGNFSSVTPLGWMGAYHASDIPMIFGTYQLRPGITDEERKTAETMQDYVAAFIADPENGLRNKGWSPMDKSVAVGGTMLRFAAQHGPLVQEVSTHEVDDACVKGAPYNRSP